VLDLITGDLTAPYDLRALAREVSLSPSRLAHLFKEEVGDSLTNMTLTLRLRQAARLLEHTPRGIGAIAEDVGFTSAFYFSRLFRRRFGMSPRDYRAAMAHNRTGTATPASDPAERAHWPVGRGHL
jgi:AraC family transcriptional regulator of arabinose operon